MPSINCGNCHEPHESVAEVRACYGVKSTTTEPMVTTATIERTVARGNRSYGGASQAQIDHIKRLCGYKGEDVNEQRINAMSSREASSEIDRLASLPYVKKPTEAVRTSGPIVALDDGMYEKGDTIFKVYHTVRGANQQVAKELVQSEYDKSWYFEYRGKKPLHGLTPEHRMSLEAAKAFGQLYGICCVCGAELTDETSVANGIGPICGKRF